MTSLKMADGTASLVLVVFIGVLATIQCKDNHDEDVTTIGVLQGQPFTMSCQDTTNQMFKDTKLKLWKVHSTIQTKENWIVSLESGGYKLAPDLADQGRYSVKVYDADHLHFELTLVAALYEDATTYKCMHESLSKDFKVHIYSIIVYDRPVLSIEQPLSLGSRRTTKCRLEYESPHALQPNVNMSLVLDGEQISNEHTKPYMNTVRVVAILTIKPELHAKLLYCYADVSGNRISTEKQIILDVPRDDEDKTLPEIPDVIVAQLPSPTTDSPEQRTEANTVDYGMVDKIIYEIANISGRNMSLFLVTVNVPKPCPADCSPTPDIRIQLTHPCCKGDICKLQDVTRNCSTAPFLDLQDYDTLSQNGLNERPSTLITWIDAEPVVNILILDEGCVVRCSLHGYPEPNVWIELCGEEPNPPSMSSSTSTYTSKEKEECLKCCFRHDLNIIEKEIKQTTGWSLPYGFDLQVALGITGNLILFLVILPLLFRNSINKLYKQCPWYSTKEGTQVGSDISLIPDSGGNQSDGCETSLQRRQDSSRIQGHNM